MEKRLSVKSIAQAIEDIDYDIELNVGKISVQKAKYWSKANAFRHAHTIFYLKIFITKNKLSEINITNSSGISHQDICICYFLKNILKIKYKYIVYESPDNPLIRDKYLLQYLKDLNIKINHVNFNKFDNPFENQQENDIILFSEIIEHLDHSVLLNTLQNLKSLLKSNGELIITTPNLLSLINRIRILFGNGDGPYWGDGIENFKKGLYGHIALFDLKRLERILSDAGFDIVMKYTFSSCVYTSNNKLLKKLIYQIVSIFSRIGIKNLGETMFVTAKISATTRKISFRT